MKLGKDVKAYIDKKLGDTKDENQLRVYQVLIEGYWAGELDINPATNAVMLVEHPVPRAVTPVGAAITGAIMQSLSGGEKK
tara:strand:- start:109 stop:351 length:243 start_codon:yes stop_codon:yes gene_type:complete